MSDISKWAENEVNLACKNTTDNYAIGCYKSALKAFKSLCEDGLLHLPSTFLMN